MVSIIMTNDKRIQAAAQRVAAVADPSEVVDEVIKRLRIPSSRKIVTNRGGIKVFWDQTTTKHLTRKFAAYVLKQMDFEPLDKMIPPREMMKGDVRTLIGVDQGFIAFSKGIPVHGAADDTQDPDFDEYDDYDQWLADVKRQHPKARHNKKGLPGWVHGYGEEEDEEFVTGPDMQSDVVGVWNTHDGFGWIMRGEGAPQD